AQGTESLGCHFALSRNRPLIYQPVYSPWVNHVERLWQALHDTITRNHQCRSMWQLLKKVRHFMETASPFPGGKHGQAKV
ncbi:hypothetical protein ACP6ES_23290, partial [Klebsiella quasipneumoniae]